MLKFLVFIVILTAIVTIAKYNYTSTVLKEPVVPASVSDSVSDSDTTDSEVASPIKEIIPPIPESKVIDNNFHIFQTFNNCGPAALSMALSYYGISKSQQELGLDLRPYQNSQGINDDKSVTLAELADKALEYDLIPYHRPNGTVDILKLFISNDIPVITRTRSTEQDDIGHYRVVKGYDDATQEFIQDDSLQGHNLRYSYTDFNNLWQMFNYEYLVLVPQNKKDIAQNILGTEIDETTSWKKAVANSHMELEKKPNDVYTRFNLSIALYHTGNFQESVAEFEKVEDTLPFRALWYQIEPIQAYFVLGDYARVMNLTEKILTNQNQAFSELYIIRGEVHKKQGDIETAKKEFEKAVFYNKNLKMAKQELQSL